MLRLEIRIVVLTGHSVYLINLHRGDIGFPSDAEQAEVANCIKNISKSRSMEESAGYSCIPRPIRLRERVAKNATSSQTQTLNVVHAWFMQDARLSCTTTSSRRHDGKYSELMGSLLTYDLGNDMACIALHVACPDFFDCSRCDHPRASQ